MSVPLTMVFHPDPTPPLTVERVADHLSRLLPGANVTDLSTEDHALSFKVDDRDVVLGLMPGAMPWEELKHIHDTSMLWPESVGVDGLQQHASHTICTIVSEDDNDLKQAELLTLVTSAVLEADQNAAGVLWSSAEMVIHRKIFQDFVREIMPNGPPVLLWIKIALGDSPEGKGLLAGFTVGLGAFGHKEVETVDATDSAEELMDRFSGLAAYLLENGPVVEDGHTIGATKNEQIRVEIVNGSFGQQEKVMRLVYRRPARKPWWKFW